MNFLYHLVSNDNVIRKSSGITIYKTAQQKWLMPGMQDRLNAMCTYTISALAKAAPYILHYIVTMV